MSHYATLRDYRFQADADDIRGAALYGEGGKKLARIHDIVFNHENGDIQYLVADCGHDRRVLVPVDRVFRSVTDEKSFSSGLTSEDLDHLPAFNDHMLAENQWKDYEQLYRSAMEDRDRLKVRYERQWTEDPVQHREGAPAHSITPTPAPAPARRNNVTPIDRGRRRNDYTPDVTPQRIAPVFGATRNASEKLAMVPLAGSSRGPAAEYVAAGLGPKWNGFQERVRRDLHRIRQSCDVCGSKKRRIA
jgi:hypothetical protein